MYFGIRIYLFLVVLIKSISTFEFEQAIKINNPIGEKTG